MEALEGFKVIRPDLPGSARSALPSDRLSIDVYVAALEGLLAEMNVESVHIAAHSLGTIVAQHFAARNPSKVKSLALFGPLVAPPDAARPNIAARAQLARSGAAGMQEIADAIVKGATSKETKEQQPAVLALVRESVMRQPAEGYAQSCEALAAAQAAAIEGIRVPTLLVTGDQDGVAPASQRRRDGRAHSRQPQRRFRRLRPLDDLRETASVHAGAAELPRRHPLGPPTSHVPSTTGLLEGRRRLVMSKIAFTNVNIFDGSGEDTFKGEVLVEGKRIVDIVRSPQRVSTDGARVIDGKGRFLMPGMTEAHTHFSWNDQPSLAAIQFMPPEEHILWCVRVAKRYLDMGWTSAIGAAAAKPGSTWCCAMPSRRASSPARAISPAARRSPPSVRWATTRCRTCSSRSSASAASAAARRRFAARRAPSSSTASTT